MLLAALLSVALYFAWQNTLLTRQSFGILLGIDLLLMVLIVERMIHTTYTITADRTLIIRRGKLSRTLIIPLDDISRIDRINRLRVGGKPLQTFLVIVLQSGAEHYITPRNEEDFIQCIIKNKTKD